MKQKEETKMKDFAESMGCLVIIIAVAFFIFMLITGEMQCGRL